MKKTILAVLLVLSVPAGAERKPLALIHEFGPSPAGKELLSEKAINSTTFAPRLFGFAWETTLTEAETLGFRCTRSNPTPHVYCDHSEFSFIARFGQNLNYAKFTSILRTANRRVRKSLVAN